MEKTSEYFLPPPSFSPRAITNEKDIISRATVNELTTPLRLDGLFEAITKNDQYIFTKDKTQLKRIVFLITSQPNDFTDIVTTKNGSKHVQHLLKKSNEIQTFFHNAIIRSFFKLMTDKYGLYVPITAMRLFNNEKKIALYKETLRHALDLARDEHGCIALNQVLKDIDDIYYKFRLLDRIGRNALDLSKDIYGNFMVQNALELNDLRCNSMIVSRLKGHYVELSFNKYGSYIVEKLLEDDFLMVQVVQEVVLECDGETLMNMARHEYGNFVVVKALLVTQKLSKFDLFWGLCKKLRPFLHLMVMSRWSRRVVAILEAWVLFY